MFFLSLDINFTIFFLPFQTALNEEESLESDFKAISKIAQSLVKDSSQEDISLMLNELKVAKERLVAVRKDIPEQLRPLKTLLPQIESLEHGIVDLQKWIDGGEELLSTHRIDGNINTVEERLEKHKVIGDFSLYLRFGFKKGRPLLIEI